MDKSAAKKWILAILVVSALFRFGYLGFGRVLPVVWDAGRYASAAVAFISYFDHSGPQSFDDERGDRYRFKHYYEKYIQGEPIDFLYYTPPTLTKARDDLFFSGPLYPVLLSAVFASAPTADFTCARILGIILDLLSNWLIIVIALRLAGRRAALLAGLLYAVYFPFILASTMLLLETSTSFLLLAALYCLLRGAEDNRRGFYTAAGVLTGLLILNKPTAMFLGVPLGLGLCFHLRRELTLRAIIDRLRPYILTVLVIFAAWVVAASVKYERLTLRDPTYGAANLRQSSSIPYEGYDLDTVEPDFWKRPVLGGITADPVGYVGLLLKKLDRLWSRPYNDFKRSFIVPYDAVETLHFVLVCAGLLGLLVMAVTGFGRAAWLLLIVGYYTVVHLVFHSLSRYNVNAMPAILMAAAFFLIRAWDAVVAGDGVSRRRILAAFGLFLSAWAVNYEWVNGLLGVGLSLAGVVAVLSVRGCLLIVALALLSIVFLRGRSLLSRLVLPVGAGLIFIVTGWHSVLARDNWAEWRCPVDRREVTAGTRIYISNLQNPSEGEIIAAIIDVNTASAQRCAFAVSIGNRAETLALGEPPLSEYFYPKPVYPAYSRIIPLGLSEFRQYAVVPVPESVIVADLSRHGCVDISVTVDDLSAAPNGGINLFGSYQDGRDGLFMPSVRHTSVERYVFMDDPRIRAYAKTLSDSTVSYYIDRGESADRVLKDLSPTPGLQTGRYHMFLVRFKPDGDVLVY